MTAPTIRETKELLDSADLLSGLGRVRTARRTWICRCSAPGPNFRIDCHGEIPKGSRYFEYLGEAAGYQSGIRYCARCALAVWIPVAQHERDGADEWDSQAAAVVIALAGCEEPKAGGIVKPPWCVLCGRGPVTLYGPIPHDGSCPWRRARVLVEGLR